MGFKLSVDDSSKKMVTETDANDTITVQTGDTTGTKGSLGLNPNGGKVGIGTTTPENFNDYANDLVIDQSSSGGDCGLTIVTPPTKQGAVSFVNSNYTTGLHDGGMAYRHSVDRLILGANQKNYVSLNSDGTMLLADTEDNASATFHVKKDAADILVEGTGTSTPGDSSVTVKSYSTYDAALTLEESGASKWDIVNESNANNLQITSSSGNAITVEQGGNVGIGTTSPESILDVRGGGVTNSALSHHNTSAASSSNAAQLDHYLNTSGAGATEQVAFRLQSSFNQTDIGSRNSRVLFKTADNGTFGNAMEIKGHSVSIGPSSPNASAALDITSTSGALLMPRMTTTQRNALTAANGMVIYNTTTNAFNFYENGSWVTK